METRHLARPPHRSPAPFSSLVEADISALSHTGHRRANNEDHYLILRVGRTLETLSTSLPAGVVPARDEEVNYVMIVADGMGGHAAGEIASQTALSALIGLALELPDWILRVDQTHVRDMEDRARARFQKVSEKLIELARREPALQGMGTTLTVARSLGRDLMITHVGDSRAYLLRAGTLHRLTKDHTFAQLLVDLGRMTPEEAARSRHRHALTNVIGGTTADLEVDTEFLKLEDRDRVLLCSDGVTDLLDDHTLTRILLESANSRDACERLIQQALDAGGRDNVTVIVGAYRFPQAG
jgi:serine/threonine protein phosphatase PrpC